MLIYSHCGSSFSGSMCRAYICWMFLLMFCWLAFQIKLVLRSFDFSIMSTLFFVLIYLAYSTLLRFSSTEAWKCHKGVGGLVHLVVVEIVIVFSSSLLIIGISVVDIYCTDRCHLIKLIREQGLFAFFNGDRMHPLCTKH